MIYESLTVNLTIQFTQANFGRPCELNLTCECVIRNYDLFFFIAITHPRLFN